jgi:ABC-2 type transport system ATP-binding protein
LDNPILDIRGLSKTYKGGTVALEGVDLSIRQGEIFALLGPNGAGKTTLIGAVCGCCGRAPGRSRRSGRRDTPLARGAAADRAGAAGAGLRHVRPRRTTRSNSRGPVRVSPSDKRIEEVLRSLSLWEKRASKIRELSGGMKRRVMIAKALSHDPELLFLDEPTAGVDVELRRDMWKQIGALRDRGPRSSSPPTTSRKPRRWPTGRRDQQGQAAAGGRQGHDYRQAGQHRGADHLAEPLVALPDALAGYPVSLENDGRTLVYRAATAPERASAKPPKSSRRWSAKASASRRSTPTNRASRTYLSTWSNAAR